MKGKNLLSNYILKNGNKCDVVIVGGGVVGIGLFRDLTLHGVNCILLEKSDFASKTSQATSKMLHGGIRYLETFDFGLVMEALKEKNLWLKLAPTMVKELPLCLPIYKESKYPLFMFRIGLIIYDILSGFKNRPHKILNKAETLKLIPTLQADGLKGSGVYFDAVMDDHKLAMECLLDTLKLVEKSGNSLRGDAFSYHKVAGVEEVESGVAGKGEKDYPLNIKVEDLLNNQTLELKTKKIVYALGPYSDDMLINGKIKSNIFYGDKYQLLLSKGSHLYFSKTDLPIHHPMVLNTRDGRIIFVIPFSEQVLVGTTEVELLKEEYLEQSIDQVEISEEEKSYLISCLKTYFPSITIYPEMVKSAYSGVRPLVAKQSAVKNKNSETERQSGRSSSKTVSTSHKTSRKHLVTSYNENVYSIFGGKYTTFRTMGQDLVKKIVQSFNIKYDKKRSEMPIKEHSYIRFIDEIAIKIPSLDEAILEQILLSEKVVSFEDLVIRRLRLFNLGYWNHPKKSFQEFFIDSLPVMNNYFSVSSKEILEFKFKV